MLRPLSGILLAAALLVGCSSGKPESKEGADSKQTSADDKKWKLSGGGETGDDEKGAKQPLPEDLNRKTLAGRWQVMMMGNQATEAPLALIEVTPDKDPPAKITAQLEQIPEKLVLENPKVEENRITFGMKASVMAFTFSGQLENGTVRGTIALGPNLLPARLIATRATSLKDAQPSPLPYREEFGKAAGAKKDRVEALKQFAEKHPDSPLSLEAYQQALLSASTEKLDKDTIQELFDAYVKLAGLWGEGFQRTTQVRAIAAIIQGGSQPEMALGLLDALEKNLPEKDEAGIKDAVTSLREVATMSREQNERDAKLDEAKKQLAGDDAEAQKKARETLAEIQKQDPLNPEILYTLAGDAEKQDKKDEAINWYAQIAAAPMLERQLLQSWGDKENKKPSDALAALWKEKHGNDEGLEAHLNETYKSRLFGFAGEKAAERKVEGVPRSVLIELFTGAQCPPCVAADLALAGIESVFNPADVVTLRYHQHIPGPDQLANDDSEARFAYYKGQGTPTTILDGKQLGNIAGYTQHVPRVYKSLREAVEKELETKTEVTLKLSAEARDGQLNLSAEAENLPEDPDDALRLRMVLAEAEIAFAAPNGIRIHEMVVRSMPGTPKGVAATTEGTLKFSQKLKLDEFRRKLTEYLAAFEEQNPTAEFKSKPMALDKLFFVAFVQSDKTGEVLQTAVVPVTGTIEYGKKPAEKPADKPEEKAGAKPEEK